MQDDATGSSVRANFISEIVTVAYFRCCQVPGIRAVHGLCTVRWPRSMQVLLIYTCGLPKKTPAAKTNSAAFSGPPIRLKARDDSFSIRVVSSTVCKTIFSSSTRIENVSPTTPLRFTPQRRRRRRRPAVVGGLFEGVAEPE